MPIRYHRFEDSLPFRGLWCISIPLGLTAVALHNPQIRRAVAKAFLNPDLGEAHLVLWVGVEPRWVIQLICLQAREAQLRSRNAVRRSTLRNRACSRTVTLSTKTPALFEARETTPV
jgi:hypothetical protein